MNFNVLIKCHVLVLMLYIPKLLAWDSHYLITYGALTTKISNKATVAAERLEDFLTQEEAGLSRILAEQEKWSRRYIQHYPPMPSYLYWHHQNESTSLVLRFTQAIRVNPLMSFPLFIQYPQTNSRHPTNLAIELDKIVVPELLNSASLHIPYPPLEVVKSGALLSPLEILATASDEPDFGMDVNLWEDSPSWFGKIYGWGPQPFGSKTLSYSSQIPFHMGLYYETSLVDVFAPYLKHSYPEYRIHQYLTLSRFAFSRGHSYWGYRFLGWALHYAQDLAQPYHSTLSPNISVTKLLYVDVLKGLGFTSQEQNVIQLLTNKHNSLENYEYFFLKNRFENTNKTNATLAALADSTQDHRYRAYSDTYPREIIAKQSHELAASLDQIISEVFPKRIVSDSDYIFYETESAVNLLELTQNSEHVTALNAQLNELLANVGSHSRKLVESVVKR